MDPSILIYATDESKDLTDAVVINGEFGSLTQNLTGFYLPVKYETKPGVHKVLVKRDQYGFPVAFLIYDAAQKQWHLRREENVFKLSNNTLAYFDSNTLHPEHLTGSNCFFGGVKIKSFVQKVPKYIMVSGLAQAGFGGEQAFKE